MSEPVSFPHTTYVKATKPFQFRVPGKPGKPITVMTGDWFWIVSPQYVQKRDGTIAIARKGKNMAYAYTFPMETFLEYFAVAS